MAWILEEPLPILLLGVAAIAVLAVILVQTGRGITLLTMAGVLLLTGCLLLVQWLIVTESERIETVLEQIAAAAKANNSQAVLDHVAGDALQLRKEIQDRMSAFHFRFVSITSGPDIVVVDSADPPSAKAVLVVRIAVQPKRGHIIEGSTVVRLSVHLVKHAGLWQVSEYQIIR